MHDNGSSFHLSASGKILIVGAKASNFDPEYREHKQLMFWDSTDPATSRKNYIPKKVEVVLFMKWVDHSLTERLIRAAKNQGVQSLRVVQSPGRIKDIMISLLRESDEERKNTPRLPEKILLPRRERQTPAIPAYSATENTAAMGHEPTQTIQGGAPMQTQEQEEATKSTPEIPDASNTKKKVGKGVLKNFIENNANIAATGFTQEVERLFALAREAGIHTTSKSISVRFSELKRAHSGKQSDAGRAVNKRGLRNPEKTLERFNKHLQGVQDEGIKLVEYVESLQKKFQELKKDAAETRALKKKWKALRMALK